MLSAARAKRPCPKCRRQLLHLFVENIFTHAPSNAPALTRFRAGSQPIARSRRIDSRCFSTTRSKFQEVGPDTEPDAQAGAQPPSPNEIELIVRQAKRAFGDTLPKGYLTDEEYKIYCRLFGPPLRETQPEDVGMPIPTDDVLAEEGEEYGFEPSRNIVLREMEDGSYERFVYEGEETAEIDPEEGEETAEIDPEEGEETAEIDPEESQAAIYNGGTEPALDDTLPSEAGLTYISAVAENEREFKALLKLQKDFEAAALQRSEREMAEESYDEEEEQNEHDEGDEEHIGDEEETRDLYAHSLDRAHEYTKLGYWGTSPSTLQLPKRNFVTPITELLERTSMRHVKDAAEETFGGSLLPFSVATPPSKRNVEQKPIAMTAGYHKMSEIDADAFIASMLPGMYASAMSVLVEMRKRLGSDWMTKLMFRGNGEGPRVLDVGGGGAGLVAWEQVLQAEWDLARENGAKIGYDPPGKKTAVVGSDHLRQRVSRFLHNTTFLPRLPDYLHSGDHPDKLEGGEAPLPRKQFDIIIASHQMMPLKEGFRRKAMLNNLWEMLSPEGGVLIVLEKGYPRGFEAVADVRARLLAEFIESPTSDPQLEPIEPETRRPREPGMIVAPCTNHKACPMYLTPGLNLGRKDFCHFSQRFIRPPFLQKILGATHRNHEDIDFSFIAVQRGTLAGTGKTTWPSRWDDLTGDAFKGYENSPVVPDPQSLPRNILPPIKRQGHITLDVCTPTGMLERWTVPRSFSKQAYRDARKAQWGDLWALGAKTRVPRTVRLGRDGVVPNDGGVRAQRAAKGGKARKIALNANGSGIFHASEGGRGSGSERRTKGGKKVRGSNLMKELGLEESYSPNGAKIQAF